MKDVESYVKALGLNSLVKSYDSNQKSLGLKYIKENFVDIPDMLDYLDDKVLIEVMKAYKSDIKKWIIEKANAEKAAQSKLFVVGGGNE
jgi:hypothetical protein